MSGKLLLTVAYNGANYCGYQVQPNGVTVQEMLNKAAESLFGFPCDIVGCSRTDSGVHARGFCATVAKRGRTRFLQPSPLRVYRVRSMRIYPLTLPFWTQKRCQVHSTRAMTWCIRSMNI